MNDPLLLAVAFAFGFVVFAVAVWRDNPRPR
jgi:hypothetical protein